MAHPKRTPARYSFTSAAVGSGRHELIQGQFLRGSEDALSPLHEANILGYAKHPGSHALGLAKLVEALEHLQQRLLCNLFGIFALAAHAHPEAINAVAESIHEPVEGPRNAIDHLAKDGFIPRAIGGFSGRRREIALHSASRFVTD